MIDALHGQIIQGSYEHDPTYNPDLPYYNSDKTPIKQASEKFSIPKTKRFEELPSYKRYQLTVPHSYQTNNSPGYDHVKGKYDVDEAAKEIAKLNNSSDCIGINAATSGSLGKRGKKSVQHMQSMDQPQVFLHEGDSPNRFKKREMLLGDRSIDNAVTRSGTHRMVADRKSLERVTLLPGIKRDAPGSTFGKTSRAIDITKYNCQQHVQLGLM
jgi:hypothetical protein